MAENEGTDGIVLDTWAGLSHKRPMSGTNVPGLSYILPDWMGSHRRRIMAYRILLAYRENIARHFLADDDTEARKERREYGDAALLIDVSKAAVLGEEVSVVVDGAEESDQENSQAQALQRVQDWLRQWAVDELFQLKLLEAERDAIGLGDGVYVLSWSNKKNRPTLTVYGPDTYFPVLPDNGDGGFPDKVHFAWELEADPAVPAATRIRRITYELVERTVPGPDGGPVPAEPRRLPYHGPEEEPTNLTCVVTDGIYYLDNKRPTVDDTGASRVDYQVDEDGVEMNRLDLDIDFIPVVHVPNTFSSVGHFGRSVLMSVAQILDDLSAADTDLAKAASTTAVPAIGLSGEEMPQTDTLVVKPGMVYKLGKNGRMDVLDTSSALDAIVKYIEHLLKRLSENSRIPQEVLGRVTSADAVAGVAMALSFGPMRGLVHELRLVRDDKYRLLWKFVQRFAVLGGLLDSVAVARLEMGQFLPSDDAAEIAKVIELVQAKIISKRTGMRRLQALGVPIDDVDEELAQIEREDTEGALQVFEATGSSSAAARRLGITDPDVDDGSGSGSGDDDLDLDLPV